MLPAWLSGSYQTYKKLNNGIATWLAETAREHGYNDVSVGSDTALQQAKIHAKTKPSKKSGRAKKKPPKAEQTRKYTLTSKDYLKLAEYITKVTRDRVNIPPDLINTIKSVIEARRKCNTFYKQQDSGDVSDDGGHTFFIKVLEGILHMLEPFCKHDTGRRQRDEDINIKGGLQNIFASLSVEESSEEFLKTSSDSKTARRSVEYEAETLDDARMLSFAVYCLFSDLNDIRNFLQRLWKDNQAGIVDLVTAAITTNTAVDLVRRIQAEFLQDFPKQENFEDLVRLYYCIQCVTRGQDPGFREMADDPFNLACYDIADWMFLPAYAQLNSFAALVQPHHLYVYKPGHFGTYEPCSDRSVKTNREKFQEDRIVLLEVMADFCFVAQMTNEIPAEDELTRGLRGLVEDKKIPLWLDFAAQNFLDIHHIFRQDVGNAFAVLQETGRQARQTIEQNLLFHQSLRIPNWPPHNDIGLRRLIIFIEEWSLEDAIAKSTNKIFKKYPGPHSPHVPSDFHLLRRHPLLCGLSCFSIRVQVQEASILFINAWGSIMYSGHLYNAVRQEGFCNSAWPDMEQLFYFHTPEQFFAGSPPETTHAYIKQFQICMGEAASTAGASHPPSRGMVLSSSGPKVLDIACPVLELFKPRYCDNANLFDLNLKLVERTLNERFTIVRENEDIEFRNQKSGDESPTGPSKSKVPEREENSKTGKEKPALPLAFKADGLEKDSNKARKNKKTRSRQRAICSRFQKTKALHPLDLLVVLQVAIEDELLGLYFDYFAFHRKCWSLLCAVREALHSQLLKFGPPNYIEAEHQLPFVVGLTFGIAYRSERIAEAAGLTSSVRTGSRILMSAGEVMDAFLAE